MLEGEELDGHLQKNNQNIYIDQGKWQLIRFFVITNIQLLENKCIKRVSDLFFMNNVILKLSFEQCILHVSTPIFQISFCIWLTVFVYFNLLYLCLWCVPL